MEIADCVWIRKIWPVKQRQCTVSEGTLRVHKASNSTPKKNLYIFMYICFRFFSIFFDLYIYAIWFLFYELVYYVLCSSLFQAVNKIKEKRVDVIVICIKFWVEYYYYIPYCLLTVLLYYMVSVKVYTYNCYCYCFLFLFQYIRSSEFNTIQKLLFMYKRRGRKIFFFLYYFCIIFGVLFISITLFLLLFCFVIFVLQ